MNNQIIPPDPYVRGGHPMTFDELRKEYLGIHRSEGVDVARRWISDLRLHDPDPDTRDHATLMWVSGVQPFAGANVGELSDIVLEIYPRLQDNEARVYALLSLLFLSNMNANRERMRTYSEMAQKIVRRPEVFHWRGRIFLSLATAAEINGDAEAVEDYVKLANEHHRRPAYGPYDRWDRLAMLATGMILLGDVYVTTDRLSQAVELLAQMPSEPHGMIGYVYRLRARIALVQGDWAAYDAEMSSAWEAYRKRPEPLLEMELTELQIRERLLKGQKEEAAQLIDIAEQRAQSLGYGKILAQIQVHRAKLKEVSV